MDAYRLAFACDPVSAYGSIIAVNQEVGRDLVEEIGSLFVEVLVAPAYTAGALAWLAEHKKNCRVMVSASRQAGDAGFTQPWLLRSVADGILAQSPDILGTDESNWRVVTRRQPNAGERLSMAFAWSAVKHV